MCYRGETHLNKEANSIFFHIELTLLRTETPGLDSLVWSGSDQFPSTEWGIKCYRTQQLFSKSRVTTHDSPVAFTEVF